MTTLRPHENPPRPSASARPSAAAPAQGCARTRQPANATVRTVPALLAGLLMAAMAVAVTAPARAATPAELLAGYTTEAGAPASAERGQRFFTSVQGREWSCSSCHGKLPVGPGRHAATGKAIGALAPAANPERFSDAAKTEKWFRRNCNDVAGRACTAGEKADVLAWLMTLKP